MQEAVVDVSLHQAGFAHTLLSQHHHFGVHTDRAHPDPVWGSGRALGIFSRETSAEDADRKTKAVTTFIQKLKTLFKTCFLTKHSLVFA